MALAIAAVVFLTWVDDVALGTEVEVSKRIITTDQAPTAVGPYSQAVVLDGWVWTCGQVALDPATGEMVGSDAATQADRALRNIEAILQAAGSGLDPGCSRRGSASRIARSPAPVHGSGA